MLTQEQIEQYDRKGYIGVENVLSPEEVEELRKVTDDFVEKSRGVSESDEVFDLESGHSPEHPKLRRLKSPINIHDVYRRKTPARLTMIRNTIQEIIERTGMCAIMMRKILCISRP